jgi:uncharacterized protein
MKHEAPPRHLDVKAFAQASAVITGRNLLSEYERLILETQGLGSKNDLEWSARGELRVDALGGEQVWLHLRVEVRLPLTCQRCMTPTEIAVAVQRSLRFVGSEEAAEAEDTESEEDLLVLSADLNLTELIEDEVLMELPLIPKHDVCPVTVKLAAVDPGFDAAALEKRRPFELLAQLKSDKSD